MAEEKQSQQEQQEGPANEQASWNPFGSGRYTEDNPSGDRTTYSVSDDEDSPEPIYDDKDSSVGEPFKDDDGDTGKEQGDDDRSSDSGAEGEATDGEAAIVDAFMDVLAEDFNFVDLPKDKRPKDIHQFGQLVNDIIAHNSVPRYAHPESQRFDEYVRNGGDPYQYMQGAAEASYGDINIEQEAGQRYAVAELLRLQGNTPQMINRKVIALEKAGGLKDEAIDAVNILKTYQEERRNLMLQEQKQMQQQQAQQEQEMHGYMVQALTDTEEVLGVPMTNKLRRELFEYMYATDKNGYSQFVLDYTSNPENVITAALLCKMKNEVSRKGAQVHQKRAVDRFRDTIARQNIRPKGQSRTGTQRKSKEGFDMSVWRSMQRK